MESDRERFVALIGQATRALDTLVVTAHDCGTLDGIDVSAIVAGGEVYKSFEQRLEGRIAATDIVDPYGGELIIPRDARTTVMPIVDAGIDRARIRSPITCEAAVGVCALCYGHQSDGEISKLGDKVGAGAARSIAELAALRSIGRAHKNFHIGAFPTTPLGSGSTVPYSGKVEAVVELRNVVDGLTAEARLDERCGRATWAIIDADFADPPPALVLRVANSAQDVCEIRLRDDDLVFVGDGEHVAPGHVLLSHRSSPRTCHVPGVFERLKRLLEASSPAEAATLVGIEGTIELRKRGPGAREVIVHPRLLEPRTYPIHGQVRVRTGDSVSAGESLTEGEPSPRDVLRILGRKAYASWILDEWAEAVDGLEGGRSFREVHLELVLRLMMSCCSIEDPGDTGLCAEALVQFAAIEQVNLELLKRGGRPARVVSLLRGLGEIE